MPEVQNITAIDILIRLVLMSILVERLTELLVDSEILSFIRKPLGKLVFKDKPENNFKQHFLIKLNYLVNCGYCCSVWVSAFASLIYSPTIVSGFIINWFICTIIMHGLSNVVHDIFQLIARGRVKVIDLNITYVNQSHDDIEETIEGRIND